MYPFPDFIHVIIAQGDAAVGPVEILHNTAEPTEVVTLAVDHDKFARIDSQFFGTGLIFGIGVGDMDGPVVGAVCLFVIEDIMTLRCLFIPFLLFMSLGIITKDHGIAFYRFTLVKQIELLFTFNHLNGIYLYLFCEKHC